MRSSNRNTELTPAERNLKALVEKSITKQDKLVILEHFTTVSHTYTDEYAFAVVDEDSQCIYLLADIVPSLDEQELTARAKHIPTVNGYLFYSSEKSQLALDGEFKVIRGDSPLFNISYINFESSYRYWRESNYNEIRDLVTDLRNSRCMEYVVSE